MTERISRICVEEEDDRGMLLVRIEGSIGGYWGSEEQRVVVLLLVSDLRPHPSIIVKRSGPPLDFSLVNLSTARLA